MNSVASFVPEADSPGRSCRRSYRYGAEALATAPEQNTHCLYIAGGLYGNRQALHALLGLIGRETGPARLCFNGDFHWFDIDQPTFRDINAVVLGNDACLGNVEAELLATDDVAGCGCAYPAGIDADTVDRSNAIHARLKQTARSLQNALAGLSALPMVRRYRVGDVAVGVVHGDAESLAGWHFDAAALDDPCNRDWVETAFNTAQVEIFASSHTCLPALRRFEGGWVANNGAAGMPNFAGRQHGVVTRIAVSPAPTPVLYGGRLGALHVDALALDYDGAAWERDFLANWLPGSPAHVSYYRRIVDGPDYVLPRAAPETT